MVETEIKLPIKLTVTAYLALGSNLGDRQENLKTAIDKLGGVAGIELISLSPLFETGHVGPPAPDHLNCALEISTVLPPESLLFFCQQIENDLGRDRDNEVRWGARTIDIDISLYDAIVLQSPTLIIPHPRLCQRRFMLEPLAAIAGNVLIPGFNTSVKDVLMWPSNQKESVTRVEWVDD